MIKPIAEDKFLRQVISLAKLRGWRVAHFRAARTERGWRTPVQGDGAGFLDLVLVRERVIWAELKSEKGKVRPEQEEWIAALQAAGQEVYVWRPSDWDEITRVLTVEDR